MRRVRVVLLLVVVFSVPMLGQSGKSELFGGYSFERIAAGCGSDYRCRINSIGATANLSGWTASMTEYLYKSLGLSAQFSGDYGSAGFAGGGGGLSSVHR